MTETARPRTVLLHGTKRAAPKHYGPETMTDVPTFKIRSAIRCDMTRCGEILNHWIDETPWMPRIHSREDVIRYHAAFVFDNQNGLVAENDASDVQGFAATSADAVVTGFYLAPEARQKGLGQSMLSRIKQANPFGLSLWTFVANIDAQRFYLREGFSERRRTDGDNEENLPDILYCWQPEGAAA